MQFCANLHCSFARWFVERAGGFAPRTHSDKAKCGEGCILGNMLLWHAVAGSCRGLLRARVADSGREKPGDRKFGCVVYGKLDDVKKMYFM